MFHITPRVPRFLVVTAAALSALAPAFAPAYSQTACITANCTLAGTPAPCLNRAAPRTPTVQMGSGVSLIFVPASPRIEPGDCIVWRAATSTHSSSDNGCTASSMCDTPPPVECQWDTANVASLAATPTS